MPPSMRSGYTLADFILRLERSPISHMSPLYHENRQLFLHRPDVMDKVVLSLSWEKGLALVEAAYYSQRIEVSTYRALLARMLLHNKHVRQQGRHDATAMAAFSQGNTTRSTLATKNEALGVPASARYVDWQAAMKVYMEALTAHGHAVPSRLGVSTLRLLAPHGEAAAAALRVLRIAEANEKLTKPMLLDGAVCCAQGKRWAEALRLLRCLHAEDPVMLTEAIQSLRPPGSDTLALTATGSAVNTSPPAWTPMEGGAPFAAPPFPGNTPHPAPPTPTQQHILRSLNTVVSAVPAPVALRDELCFSYLTHLTASTTLSADDKAVLLGAAIETLSWSETVLLLNAYTEPNLVSDAEWKALQGQLPHPAGVALLDEGSENRGARKKAKDGKSKKAKKASRAAKEIKRRAAATGKEMSDASELSEAMGRVEGCDRKDTVPPPTDLEEDASVVHASDSPTTGEEGNEHDAVTLASSVLHETLATRLRLSDCSPATAAALLAVLVAKMPTVQDAWRFIAEATHTSSTEAVPFLSESTPGEVFVVTDASMRQAVALAGQLHVVVRRALLRRCSVEPRGKGHTRAWPVAAAVLLAQGGAHGATPTAVLSPIILELRAERQVPLLMRILLEHIVPTGGRLTEEAVEAVLACILAHNRAAHQLQAEHAAAVVAAGQNGERVPDMSQAQQAASTVVPWQSVASWAVDLQAERKERRIAQTGTGPSAGAPQRRAVALVEEEVPLTPRMLSLLLHICVDAGSPQGALEALGRARRVDKTELAFAAELRAVLYCMLYNRPYEAEAIVQRAEEKHGAGKTAPLRQLLEAAQATKVREEMLAEASELSD